MERLMSSPLAAVLGTMVPITSALVVAIDAHAQSFSCRFGTQPACLDSGDTVCSWLGKCVDEDAVCFEPYQCDYEGFTCRSNLTDCADDYEDLADDYNNLVRDAREMATEFDRLTSEYEALFSEHQELRVQFSRLEAERNRLDLELREARNELSDVVSCIQNAGLASSFRACVEGR